MPGRTLLGRIVEEYHLNESEAFRLFTKGDPDQFGQYLREHVFEPPEDVEEGTQVQDSPTESSADATASDKAA